MPLCNIRKTLLGQILHRYSPHAMAYRSNIQTLILNLKLTIYFKSTVFAIKCITVDPLFGKLLSVSKRVSDKINIILSAGKD